jgi:hypothetical protein
LKQLGIAIALIVQSVLLSAQDGSEWVHQTFRDTRVVSGHSVETNDGGQMKFIIGHRFGEVSGGAYELFGIDQSTIRFGLDYGITNNFTVGIGRSSFEKTYDGFLKYRILQQRSGEKPMPVTVTALSSIAVYGLKWDDPDRENYFTSRLYYSFQALIARKFSDTFSLQLMPSLVHRNIVPTDEVAHDVLSLGAGGRFQVSSVVALQAEYYYTPQDQLGPGRTNSLSVGVDIDTKGHVFQLHVSNSRGMIEKFLITETTGDILDGDLHLGFNITRDFRLTGRK